MRRSRRRHTQFTSLGRTLLAPRRTSPLTTLFTNPRHNLFSGRTCDYSVAVQSHARTIASYNLCSNHYRYELLAMMQADTPCRCPTPFARITSCPSHLLQCTLESPPTIQEYTLLCRTVTRSAMAVRIDFAALQFRYHYGRIVVWISASQARLLVYSAQRNRWSPPRDGATCGIC